MNRADRYAVQRQRRQQRRREILAIEPHANLFASPGDICRIAVPAARGFFTIGEGTTANQAWFDAWTHLCGPGRGGAPSPPS